MLMKKNQKNKWKTPSIQTVEDNQVNKAISALACSRYFEGCHPSNWHMDSIPGLPSVDVL